MCVYVWFTSFVFFFYYHSDAKNMARNVKEILLEIIQEKGKKSLAEAQAFLKRMEAQRKYAADVWS